MLCDLYGETFEKEEGNGGVTKGTVPVVTFSRENVTLGTVPFVTLYENKGGIYGKDEYSGAVWISGV